MLDINKNLLFQSKKMIAQLLFFLSCVISPKLVFAYAGRDLDGVMGVIMDLIDGLVVVITGLALVFFLWGLAKFILKAGDEAERAKGKQVMLWGLITLFVMVTVWAIVLFLQSAFFGPGASITDPWSPPAI